MADTENHMLRKVDLQKRGRLRRSPARGTKRGRGRVLIRRHCRGCKGSCQTLCGTRRGTTELNSPWDLVIHGQDLYIAMAGPHQIWKMPLDETEIGPYAGNGREDIVDGPLMPKEPYEAGYSSFAQPSGLATDGKTLYVADSEGSSIRAVPLAAGGEVKTVVGTSALQAGRRLFTFGDQDGTGRDVLLQHPLGVAFADGVLYVADTYNNKIKAIDVRERKVRTLAGSGKPGRGDAPAEFDEPAGLSVAAGKLYVADTNNHAIRTIELHGPQRVATLSIAGLAPPKIARPAAPAAAEGERIQLAPVSLAPQDGLVWLAVKLSLPVGYKINPLGPMQYKVTSTNDAGPLDRAALGRNIKVDPPAAEFQIELPVAQPNGEETLVVTLDYYYCQDGESGLCKAGRATWTLPLSLSVKAEGATARLPLRVE